MTTSILVTPDMHLDEATLGFTCNYDGALGLSVAFAPLLNISNDTLLVIQRFDKEEPAWRRWIGGPGVISLIEEADTNVNSLLFAGMAMGASQVVLRLFDDSGDSHTYTFSLMGVTAGLLNMPCWDPFEILEGLIG